MKRSREERSREDDAEIDSAFDNFQQKHEELTQSRRRLMTAIRAKIKALTPAHRATLEELWQHTQRSITKGILSDPHKVASELSHLLIKFHLTNKTTHLSFQAELGKNIKNETGYYAKFAMHCAYSEQTKLVRFFIRDDLFVCRFGGNTYADLRHETLESLSPLLKTDFELETGRLKMDGVVKLMQRLRQGQEPTPTPTNESGK